MSDTVDNRQPLLIPTKGPRFAIFASWEGRLRPVVVSSQDYVDLLGAISERVEAPNAAARAAARRVDSLVLNEKYGPIELLIDSVRMRQSRIYYFETGSEFPVSPATSDGRRRYRSFLFAFEVDYAGPELLSAIKEVTSRVKAVRHELDACLFDDDAFGVISIMAPIISRLRRARREALRSRRMRAIIVLTFLLYALLAFVVSVAVLR